MMFRVVLKTQSAGYTFATRRYDMTQLIYVERGQMTLQHSGHAFAIRSGMFALLRAGGVFELQCEGQGYDGIGVLVTGSLPEELCGPPLLGLSDNRLRSLQALLGRHLQAPLPESQGVLEGLGQALVWEALALVRERTPAREIDWAAAARTALDIQLGTGASVRTALATLPISYRQLARCMREELGVSPKHYQEQRRIDEARRLLSSTTMDITGIAYELGFSSSQHFATRFRRLAGCSPTAYRKTSRAAG